MPIWPKSTAEFADSTDLCADLGGTTDINVD